MQQNSKIYEEYLPSSFRDPSGRIFKKNGRIYRNIHVSYKDNFDYLIKSKLYDQLVDKGWMVPHQEVAIPLSVSSQDLTYKTILPDMIKFISYPYEWCFSQQKDAAILTLEIQLLALKHKMMLKDASAFNIQFKDGRPVLIDTLSFEKIKDGEPWPAYQQFCKHFLAPLTLMSQIDSRINQLSRNFIDGIPLDLASQLLPRTSWLRPAYLVHLHLHSWMQRKHSSTKNGGSQKQKKSVSVSESGVRGLIESLLRSIKRIKCPREQTEWGDYYNDTNYSQRGLEHKVAIVDTLLDQVQPRNIWDLGANNGFFSRLGAKKNSHVIAMDGDHEAVEYNYLKVRETKERNILPLVMDLTNPSGGIGFNNIERSALFERGPTDLVISLALVHHLAISNNTPFELLSDFFAKCGRALIIEFVPKDDSQVQRLLSSRKDIFSDYTQERFEQAFDKDYEFYDKIQIADSKRSIYLMRRKE